MGLLGLVFPYLSIYNVLTGPPAGLSTEERNFTVNKTNIGKIRETAQWLSLQSVSSNGDSNAVITKADLERFKQNVSLAFSQIADALEED